MVQEFHLSVTPIRDDENLYYVRVERVEQGVPLAEEQVIWPVEEWLAQARQVFTDPLSEFFQSSPEAPYEVIPVDPLSSASGSPSEPALVALGQSLYNALFKGTVRDSWVTAQGVAQNRQEPLRLRLGLKGERLTRLPWEVLHAGNRPIAAATDVVFSRYQGQLNAASSPGSLLAAPPSLPASLHILMVLAAPTDQANLELKREALQLRQELQQHRRSDSQGNLPEIQLTLLEHPGREELTQVLEQAPYQVFHFAGHSSPGPSGGRLHLVNSRNGLTESLNGDDLAGLLANNGIQLAVINSCLGTQAATSNEFDLQGERTLAEALVRRGIPGVLAMAERIPDQVALTLSRLFYRNLKFGQPLDLSLCRARQGLISAYGSNQLYWALPILYLHSDFAGRLVRPAPGWQDSAPFQEMGEPLLAGMDAGNYRGGGAAIAMPSDTDLVDPFALGDDDLLFDPQDPQMNQAVNQLEADLAPATGAGVDASDLTLAEGRPPAIAPHSAVSDTSTSNTSASDAVVVHPRQTAPTAVNPQPTQPSPKAPFSTFVQKPVVWLLACATGLLLLGAVLWGMNRPTSVPGTLGTNPRGENTSNLTSDDWLAKGFEGASAQNVGQMTQALDALLDQGALGDAQKLVSRLHPSLLDQASEAEQWEARFLTGRLNWQQFSQAQTASFTPSDREAVVAQAREADIYLFDAHLQWKTLFQEAPDNLRYRNAYALSLIAQDKPKDLLEAQSVLNAGLKLISQEQTDERLATYANLALVAMQLAQADDVTKPDELWNDAAAFYRTVVDEDPRSYTPEALQQDFNRFWMWTPQMLQAWEKLGQVAAGGS